MGKYKLLARVPIDGELKEAGEIVTLADGESPARQWLMEDKIEPVIPKKRADGKD